MCTRVCYCGRGSNYPCSTILEGGVSVVSIDAESFPDTIKYRMSIFFARKDLKTGEGVEICCSDDGGGHCK